MDEPIQLWATDITYIHTYEGWPFLGVVIDLFSLHVVGGSMSERINTNLVLDAITMACWRRKPKTEVLVHSDQVIITLVMIGAVCWRPII